MPVGADGVVVAAGGGIDEVLVFQVRAPDAHRLLALARPGGGDDRCVGTQGGRGGPAVLSYERQTGDERRILEAGGVEVLRGGEARCDQRRERGRKDDQPK